MKFFMFNRTKHRITSYVTGNLRFFKRLPVVLFFILLSLSVANALEEPNPPPFAVGERLTYVLKWEFIRAGEAVLEVMPPEEVNGIMAYRFVMTARSRKTIDRFYKVRDRIDAFANLEMTHSLLYLKNQREGKTRREVVIKFDWDSNQAQYSNFGRAREPIPLMDGAFDPLSAFYFTRFFNFQENTVIERPVTDGKKCVIGRAKVIKRERITVEAGTFDTFLIEPELEHVGGVFEKADGADVHVWVTADHRKIPVKISSKVVVGSFIGELISAENLTD